MPLNLKSVANGSVILDPASTVTDKTITIPATDGTMVVQDGTNTTTLTNVSYSGTLTGGTGVINIGSGQVYKDASGNVGIGTTSPAVKLHVVRTDGGTIARLAGASYALRTQSLAGVGASIEATNSTEATYQPLLVGGSQVQFTIAGAERARIDSSGNLLVGTTSQRSAGKICFDINGSVNAGIVAYPLTNSGIDVMRVLNNAGSMVGTIQGTPTQTLYNTSSDYRLKENVAPMQKALATVAQLKPCTYTWKADGSAGQGFIAHELQAIVPDCVTGEKDAVDAEGKPQYQGVDTSFLVATLVSAIQELKAEFDAYKLSHP